MCDHLTTYNGAEIWSVEEARQFGLDVPVDATNLHGDAGCLCGVDLLHMLAKHTSEWRKGGWFEWDEVGPDGRTWGEGYDLRTETSEMVDLVSRSDGRRALTLADDVASRSAA